MYTLAQYGDMIADEGRTSAYERALSSCVTPSSVVLDIGTGSGILAILACRAGARKVYAVEPDDVIQVARELAVANGFANRIEFIQALTTSIALPEPVDVIVADLRGCMPMFGSSLLSIADARDRFLAPGGSLIPARETLWAALVSLPKAHARMVGRWSSESGIDLTPARDRAANEWHKRWLAPDELIVPPQCWADLDYRDLCTPNVAGRASWTVNAPSIAHGVAMWFDGETAPGVGFSNSPLSGEHHVYGQIVLWWKEPVSFSAGDRVTSHLRADLAGDEYVWCCESHVIDGGSGREKASYKQSTWLSVPLSLERLRRRASSFVPSLTDDGRIDRCILDFMAQGLPLGVIAENIVAAFPEAFKNIDAALARIGTLSDRYSR